MSVLLRVQLDDEVLLDGEVDVITSRNTDDLCDLVVCIVLKPLGCGTRAVCLNICLDLFKTTAALFKGNNHAGLYLIAGDVDLAAVNGKMTVADHLASLRAAHCEAETVNDIVQAALENAQQILAGLALAALCHLVVAAELALENTVVSLCLLLLTKLLAVLGALAASLTMLSGRIRSVLKCAFGVAAIALQEELLALSAAHAAYCFSISCHLCFPPSIRHDDASEDGSHCEEWGSRP